VKFISALWKWNTKEAAKIRNDNGYNLFPDTVYFEWGDIYYHAVPFHKGILWMEQMYKESVLYKFYYITYNKGKLYRYRMDKSLVAVSQVMSI
jgi:hypothetical protein